MVRHESTEPPIGKEDTTRILEKCDVKWNFVFRSKVIEKQEGNFFFVRPEIGSALAQVPKFLPTSFRYVI